MHNSEARRRKERQKEQIKQRYNVVIDPENYEYIPAKKQADYYDNDVNQRVAIYVRVSTDDVRQTTSYELQKKYYEEFVTRHPNWTLVNIYADEGISGTCGLTTESRLRRSCLDIPTTKTAIFKSIRMKHLLLNLFSICTSTVTLPSRLPIPLPIRRAAHISENHAGHPAASYRSFATSGTAGTFLQEKPSQKTIERTGR